MNAPSPRTAPASLLALLESTRARFLVALAFTAAGIMALLGDFSGRIDERMRKDRLDFPKELGEGGSLPQAFTKTRDPKRIGEIGKILAKPSIEPLVREYFFWDSLVFVPFYAVFGLLLLAKARRVFAPGWKRNTLGVAAGLVVVGAMADWVENISCVALLRSPQGWVQGLPRSAYFVKWISLFAAGAWLLVAAGCAVLKYSAILAKSWTLARRAHGFAMRARFSVLAGLIVSVALIGLPQGRDLIRALGGQVPDGGVLTPDAWSQLGWLLFAALNLSGAAWGWARLLLAVPLDHERARDADAGYVNVVHRIRRDLPLLFGGLPLVAVGCAFMLIALTQADHASLRESVFIFLLAPPLLIFAVPAGVILTRAELPLESDANGGGRTALKLVFGTFVFAAFVILVITQGAEGSRAGGGMFAALLRLFTQGSPAALMGLAACAAAFFVFANKHFMFSGVVPIGYFGLAYYSGQTSAAAVPAVAMLAVLVVTRWCTVRKTTPALLLIRERLNLWEMICRACWAWWEFLRLKAVLGSIGRRISEKLNVMCGPALSDGADQKAALDGLLRWLCLNALLHAGVFYCFYTHPVAVGLKLGGGAALCLGLASWLSVGSFFALGGQLQRVPVLAILIVAAVFISAEFDFHSPRVLRSTPSVAAVKTARVRHPVANAFEEWLEERDVDQPEGNLRCVIVSAEGGGLRAAYWTAVSLGALQDESIEAKLPSRFSDHVFAISGVSGGSVGAAFFSAIAASSEGTCEAKLAKMLSRDHLGPVVGSLMYGDMLQSVTPFRWLDTDRAAALELSLERAWKDEMHSSETPLASPLLAFRSPVSGAPRRWAPHLFLNATRVEDGKRVIVSDVMITSGSDGEFTDTSDAHQSLVDHTLGGQPWRDVALGTAAVFSARFPYVSPPARMPDRTRLVDGGYFENSGAGTAMEIFHAARNCRDSLRALPLHPLHDAALRVEFIILHLRVEDERRLADPFMPHRTAEDVRDPLQPASLQAKLAGNYALNGVINPIMTLAAVRSAHASYQQAGLAYRTLSDPCSDSGLQVLALEYGDSSGSVPVSWTLSPLSATVLRRALPHRFHAPRDDAPVHAPRATAGVRARNTRCAQDLFRAIYIQPENKPLAPEPAPGG